MRRRHFLFGLALFCGCQPADRPPLAVPDPDPYMPPPEGGLTITQDCLITALRLHPEKPSSVDGLCVGSLLAACQEHSLLQARLQRQGHHHWERRFHELRRQHGGTPAEVCAESWPWEAHDMQLAAESCVKSWRQSPGHWRAVSRPCRAFGYDMQQGANGIWYATGIVIQ